MCSTKWYAKQISSQHITAKTRKKIKQMVNTFDIFGEKKNIWYRKKRLSNAMITENTLLRQASL
jgi:hypothetical protein